MKKVISVIIAIILALTLFGCSNNNKSNNSFDNSQTSVTSAEATEKQLSLDDYEIIPGANVTDITDAGFGEGVLSVETICPFCGTTVNDFISVDNVKDKIGQNTFTYSRNVMCSNQANHSYEHEFDIDYPYTITFQLKN